MRSMAGTALGALMLVTGAAHAATDNPMKVCGARYQAARTAKTLPAGQSWQQFLAQCRGSLAAAQPVKRLAPDGAVGGKPVGTRATVTNTAGVPSAAQTAMRARMKQCSTQWQADKTAGRVPAGQKWPQYWSACSTRLKG